MSSEKSNFQKGDVVQRVNQPDAVGVVHEVRWNEQTESWDYQVQFGAQLKLVPSEHLQRLRPMISAWDALESRTFSGVQHFIFTLTFHRLRRPPTRIAYSFATSRTQFYPYQFKPLLKFLDSPANRLLIADDVGLGKTIEAGYIMRELEARQLVERVLVVVPARLKTKWKRELRDRFEEHFDVAGTVELRRLANLSHQGREPEPFRWIVSYETARSDEMRSAIEGIPIDLLIADEAHRMRNPESLQHKLGVTLCKFAESAVFLTATPVQNRLEDLWHLLKLLSPGEFSNWAVFRDQMQANALLLKAQQALRRRPTAKEEARQFLAQFFNSMGGHFAGTEMAGSLAQRLDAPELKRRDIIEIEADIGALSPIGHILSRTRKVEALPNKPNREAQWKPVALTPKELEIYQNVQHLCRIAWSGEGSSWGFQMSLIMAYRMTASCIPAAMAYFADRLGVRPRDLPINQADDEQPAENGESRSATDLTAWSSSTRARLAEIVKQYESKTLSDSKLKCLDELLRDIWKTDDANRRGRRKVVVFSFFRRTLEYLAVALSQRRIENRMIHGLISIEDRESAIDDFLERDDVAILLTSEVGGEGIDLQRASVVVNYDLPWNPMVVEQRIGRVDRIGQQADKILVYNLVVAESIEERVLQRLLSKIGVFQESLGELDPIIGEKIEELSEAALRGELSEDDLKQRVEETAEALEQQVQQARTMLSRVDDLLAADQNLIDEIDAVTQEHQIPSEKDLLLFLNLFLARRIAGCQIPKNAVNAVVRVDLRGELPTQMEREAVGLGADVARFARRIAGSPIDITLSRDLGYRHPKSELVNLRHPLVRFAVAQVEKDRDTLGTAFSLGLKNSSHLPRGTYGFLIASVEIKAYRPSTRLAAVIAQADGAQIWKEPEETTAIVLDILHRGEDIRASELDRESIDPLKQRLLDGLKVITNDWNSREQRLDAARRQLQAAAVLAGLELRVRRSKEALESLRSQRATDFAIRMAEAKLDKALLQRETVTTAPQNPTWGGIEQEEIAVGLVQVA
jgi:superfamily II DNA or RNA helicase